LQASEKQPGSATRRDLQIAAWKALGGHALIGMSTFFEHHFDPQRLALHPGLQAASNLAHSDR
jgi:hypothetical protein